MEVRDLIAKGDFDGALGAAQNLFPDIPQMGLTQLCLYGEVAFRQQKDDAAESHFLAALKEAPGWAAAHYGLSLVKLARGELDEALRHAQFAANQENEPRFAAQLGLCQLEARNHGAAADALARATRLDSSDWSSWNNLGIARRAKGDFSGAREAFSRALEIQPQFSRAQENLAQLDEEREAVRAAGLIEPASRLKQDDSQTVNANAALGAIKRLIALGQSAEALEAAEAYCMNSPDDGEAAVLLAELHTDRGDAGSALDVMRMFLSRHSDDFTVRAAYAVALVRERMYKPAHALLTKLLAERPDDETLLSAMANVHSDRGNMSEAGELFEKIFSLNPSLNNKGRLAASCAARCEYERVLKLTDEILAEDPRAADALIAVRVDAYTNLGLHDKALPMLDAAINMNPRDASRRFLRSSIHLLNERFDQGWDDYAMRQLSSVRHLRTVALPQWKGEPLEGKRIVVLCEQGLGDQVMFASCLTDVLAHKPARVVVECMKRVAPTLARSFPSCEVIASKQDAAMEWLRDIGELDYYASIGDLPQQFRRNLNDFPVHSGYLKADEERTAHWRRQLTVLGSRPNIGVSWRGGTQVTRKVLRTMEVTNLAPLQAAIDANWVCLQYGDVAADLTAAHDAGLELNYWPQAIEDLDEFSSLVSALDLVITVCNTTVHYAGALNVPVWVMSPRIPEWRYGLHFKSLPWYPSSVMYRQTSDRDWHDVLAAVARDLATQYGGPSLPAETFAQISPQE